MQLPENFSSRWIKAGDHQVHYLEGGQGSPVLLVHGAGGGAYNWSYNLAALAKHFHVFALDVIGFGESDKPHHVPKDIMPFLGRSLAHFIEAVGLDKTHVIGQSMGGGVSLSLALDRPDLVDRLVLVGSAALGKKVHLWFRLASLPVISIFLTKPNRKAIETFWQTQLVSTADEAYADLIEYNYQMSVMPGAAAALRKGLQHGTGLRGQKTVLLNRLQELERPTLIVWGEEDKLIPVSHARVAHRLIKGSQLCIFEQCGHLPNIEKQEEFGQVVTGFLLKDKTAESKPMGKKAAVQT